MGKSRLNKNYSRPSVARVNKKSTRGHGWSKLRVTFGEPALHLWWPPSYVPMMHGEVKKYITTIKNLKHDGKD